MSDKKQILLVDDEPSILKMVRKRLEVAGYDVTVAMDGEEALGKAKELKPALMILDLMLPKINGYEVCAAVKKDPEMKRIPVILLSARVQEKDEKEGLLCGADVYMRKPFQSQELVERVRALMDAAPSA